MINADSSPRWLASGELGDVDNAEMKTKDRACQELQRRIEIYGPKFGITRLDYERTGRGWWVRLGWKTGRPAFQKTVMDADYGGKDHSAEAARQIRDEAFMDLWLADEIPPIGPHSPFKTRRNKTGVPGMSRSRTKSKTGAGFNKGWKVNWSEEGKPRGTSFADSRYQGNPFESYRAAALFRMEKDLKIYGYSIIDPRSIDEMFAAIPESYLNQGELK